MGKILRKIPKQLFVPTCDEVNSQTENTGAPKRNQFEDYVGPNQANYYSINPTHLRNVSELRIQFEGVGYGTFTVCMVQGVNQCQSTAILEVLLFNISQPCQSDDVKTCSDINFSVELDSSNIRCTGEFGGIFWPYRLSNHFALSFQRRIAVILTKYATWSRCITWGALPTVQVVHSIVLCFCY